MARQRDHKSYMWILCIFSTNCTNKNCFSKNYAAKWYANTTNKIANKDYSKFMSAKPEYSKEELFKRALFEYYLIIKIFMKSNADLVAKHKKKWNHEIHFEKSKKASSVRNYKPFSDQKTAAMKKYIDEHLGKSFL